MVYYVDGSCTGNGSSGGFSVIQVSDDEKKLINTYNKSCTNTTNNREELKAILWVLLTHGLENPIVYSDSAYCVNSLTNWIYGWQANNWIKSDGKTVKNLDLFKVFYEYFNKGYSIQLRHIKGHNGHEWNELADEYARKRDEMND